MISLIRNLLKRFFPPRPKRLELRFVTYAEGDKLVREGWAIAKEEDRNRLIGWVYLERLEKVS
jgi:hypothetical protein